MWKRVEKDEEIQFGEVQKADKAISDTREDTSLVRGAQWMQEREKTLKNKKRLTRYEINSHNKTYQRAKHYRS